MRKSQRVASAPCFSKSLLLISLIDLFDQCENAVLAREHDFN